MRDLLIFAWGVVVGAGGLYALFALYRWADSLSSRIRSLRNEHSGIVRDIELWSEFHDWKRMTKGKE